MAEETHVSADAVLLEHASTNTRENLENSLRLLAERGISSTQMVVVTNNSTCALRIAEPRVGHSGGDRRRFTHRLVLPPVRLPPGVRRNRGALPQTESDHLCRHFRVVVGRGGGCTDHQRARGIRRRPAGATRRAGIRTQLRQTRGPRCVNTRRKRLFRRSCRSLAHVTHNTATL
ncbi:YdcF family protein [Gordonia sputi]|uniref:ElyC/SanA/YdcF family protein n=1 Tax=Gordonia sputi TaxID=36823 RepID=UPI00369E93DA